jgi:hypothetical protein
VLYPRRECVDGIAAAAVSFASAAGLERGGIALGLGDEKMIAHGMSLANYSWPDLVFGVLATLGLMAVILGLIYLKVRGEI